MSIYFQGKPDRDEEIHLYKPQPKRHGMIEGYRGANTDYISKVYCDTGAFHRKETKNPKEATCIKCLEQFNA